MKYLKILYLILYLNLISGVVMAQESDLLNILDSVSTEDTQYTYGTFKSTRVVNGHSNERMPEGQLDFRIEHRFGLINRGYYEFFGLDNATTMFSLEYGINDWVMVGVNRATFDKMVSGFSKFSILRQSKGAQNIPVSFSVLLGTSIVGTKWSNPNQTNYFSSRISYTSQLIFTRKFNENFSLLFAPTWIHRNLVAKIIDRNDVFALGFAGRYKLSRRISINVEYYPVISPSWDHQNNYTNELAFGIDIETGGHVFQLILSNSEGMTEKTFITQTTGKWLKGDIHLGFNISRVFSIK